VTYSTLSCHGLSDWAAYEAGIEKGLEAAARHIESFKWPNDCLGRAIEALRYVADHDVQSGGEQLYNAAHLLQIANELEYFTTGRIK
jgi:hypothetical protein